MRQITEFLKKLGNWLFRFFRWFFAEPLLFWITLIVIFLGVIFIWFIPVGIFNGPNFYDILETRFRLTGLILEVLGIGTVVCGLIKNLKLFEHAHPLEIIPKWFKRFPKFGRPRTIVGSMNATLGLSDSCYAIGIASLGQNTSIENRVDFLEKQNIQIFDQLHKNRIHFENEFKKLSDALNAERNERESVHKQAQHDLREFAVGDVYIELMGIIWLIIGAISATASTELAKLFG